MHPASMCVCACVRERHKKYFSENVFPLFSARSVFNFAQKMFLQDCSLISAPSGCCYFSRFASMKYTEKTRIVQNWEINIGKEEGSNLVCVCVFTAQPI